MLLASSLLPPKLASDVELAGICRWPVDVPQGRHADARVVRQRSVSPFRLLRLPGSYPQEFLGFD